MNRLILRVALSVFSLVMASAPAMADTQYFLGRVLQTQGHTNPACRMVQAKKTSDGSVAWFRIPNTGQDNSILAVTLAALAAGLQVNIAYDPAVTTGCGADPAISWISLISAN